MNSYEIHAQSQPFCSAGRKSTPDCPCALSPTAWEPPLLSPQLVGLPRPTKPPFIHRRRGSRGKQSSPESLFRKLYHCFPSRSDFHAQSTSFSPIPKPKATCEKNHQKNPSTTRNKYSPTKRMKFVLSTYDIRYWSRKGTIDYH